MGKAIKIFHFTQPKTKKFYLFELYIFLSFFLSFFFLLMISLFEVYQYKGMKDDIENQMIALTGIFATKK